jgi:prepilin-type N-terminal cleavage/methylation domain-containing protein/prepilin-type processing-associated H-X9-DG protein
MNRIAVCSDRGSGFTLIELLSVISIIAILAAVILPAIGRSKDAAARARCASNLRQFSLAIAMYGDDNQDSFPVITHRTQYRQFYALRQYIGESTGIFACPAARGRSAIGALSITDPSHALLHPSATITNTDGSRWMTDYKFNDNYRLRMTNGAPSFARPSYSISSFSAPEFVVSLDNLDWIPRHSKFQKVNLSFLDGHVETMRSTASEPNWSQQGQMTGTYTVDSKGSFPFWNWGWPTKTVDQVRR